MTFRFFTKASIFIFSCSLMLTNCSGMLLIEDTFESRMQILAQKDINILSEYLCKELEINCRIIQEIKFDPKETASMTTALTNGFTRAFNDFLNERKQFIETKEKADWLALAFTNRLRDIVEKYSAELMPCA